MQGESKGSIVQKALEFREEVQERQSVLTFAERSQLHWFPCNKHI